jgi:hypothetical protein
MGKTYEQELGQVLAMMASTLKGSNSDRASLGQAWMLVVCDKVPQAWLVPTCKWFLEHATWFPAPSEFIEKATELRERMEIQALLDSTKRALQESEALAIEDRRRRNIKAGINPDEVLPIEAIAPLLGGLETRMLLERNEVQE